MHICKPDFNRFKKLFLFLFILTLSSSFSMAQRVPKEEFVKNLVQAALERTNHVVRYDGSYRIVEYPGGDIPDNVGVCTDVIIRVYRQAGIDLQKEVHEDMSANFSKYPNTWGLTKPDRNIDHRRVPNLQTFFRRKGVELSVSKNPDDYQPGDLVTWVVPVNLPHIGIVVDKKSHDGKRPLIVHNIGRGPQLEDILFDYPITGHYRYYGNL